MKVETISASDHDRIARAAKSGSYTMTAVSFVSADLALVETAAEAAWLVVENAYTSVVLRLEAGVPVARLEEDED